MSNDILYTVSWAKETSTYYIKSPESKNSSNIEVEAREMWNIWFEYVILLMSSYNQEFLQIMRMLMQHFFGNNLLLFAQSDIVQII